MKKNYLVVALFALAAALAIAVALRTRNAPDVPVDGYLHDVHVVFPVERYTFLATTRMVAGRKIITDNLWGYHYPSLAPLLPRERADFLRAYADTDWIKVAVLARPPSNYTDPAMIATHTCMNHTIAMSDQPGRALFLDGQDVFERDKERHFGGLHRFNAPDKPPYNDARAYGGPVHMYWDDRSGAACTLILCSAYPRKRAGQHCDHTHIDTVRQLAFSMDYDAALLPHWRDIQDQTISMFNAFN